MRQPRQLQDAALDEGEELAYDYKFQWEEREEDKLPCNCGAKLCRGTMN